MADTSYYGRAGSGGGDASTPKGSSRPAASNLDQGKIFVGGLSWQTTEESLRWHFEQYGPVVSVEVMKDRVTGDPRGFAFVVFQDGATVDLVMNEPNHEINHKIVDVKRAQARGVAPPSIHEKATPSHAGSDAGDTRSDSGKSPHAKMTPEQQGNKVFVGGTFVRVGVCLLRFLARLNVSIFPFLIQAFLRISIAMNSRKSLNNSGQS